MEIVRITSLNSEVRRQNLTFFVLDRIVDFFLHYSNIKEKYVKKEGKVMLLAEVEQLKQSQALLKKLVDKIPNSSNDIKLTELHHDLLDYCESLSVITDYANLAEVTAEMRTYQIKEILQEQYKHLQAIFGALQSPTSQADVAKQFAVSPGAIRRMYESLKGIMELNHIMQKEVVEVDLKKAPLPEKIVPSKKEGFFKRLFKH